MGNFKQYISLIFGVVILFGLFFVSSLNKEQGSDIIQEESSIVQHTEIEQILAAHPYLQERVVLYRNLIGRVGATEAQEALVHSGLPHTGETHLLNHEAGYFLYEKYGPKGILKCKDYFLASCYHGALIRAIGDNGLESLSQIVEACEKVDVTIASQCAHGIGHGLLAWVGYKNLPGALSLCGEVESSNEGFLTYHCYDGVFMENNYAIHSGQRSPDRWVKADDPFYPCNDPGILERYRKACWSNQPQLLLEPFRGDFKRLGALCGEVADEEYRVTCFNSIARHIHSFTLGNADVAFDMCSNMPNTEYANCLADVGVSAFVLGDRNMPYEICQKFSKEEKDMCYNKLYGMISLYEQTKDDRLTTCEQIREEAWVKKCLEYTKN